jgi:hypothetical protein
MTLIIQKPTGAKLVLRKGWQPMDADAAAYITAVETADGQALEERTKIAIDNFVLGCKEDGIWNAIKASCILAGARTLAGALVPLVGTAPTNFNFVAGDYNRKTGLVGDASTKYLDSNTAHSLSPKNNGHCSVFASAVGSTVAPKFYLGVFESGCVTNMATSSPDNGWIMHDQGTLVPVFTDAGTGFKAISRSNSSEYIRRSQSISTTVSRSSGSATPGAPTYTIYGRNNTFLASCRLAFYSIGESLDLALLDTRVTILINAFAAAIP